MAEADNTGIAADYIQTTVVSNRLIHQFGRLRDIPDIRLQSDGIWAERFNLRDDFEGRSFRVCVVDNDFGAAATELDSHRGANTTAGACYQCNFAIEAIGVIRNGRGHVWLLSDEMPEGVVQMESCGVSEEVQGMHVC
jgi:hypothetical protein